CARVPPPPAPPAAPPPAAPLSGPSPRPPGSPSRSNFFGPPPLPALSAGLRGGLWVVAAVGPARRAGVRPHAASLGANVPFVAALVKGSAMLDVARYPEIRFVGTRFERTGATTGVLTGELTIRAMTRPITLTVRFDAGRQLEPDTGARAEREGDESDESGESNPAERRAGQGRRAAELRDGRPRDAGPGVADSRDAMRRETDSGSAHRGAEPPERIARAAPDAARPLAFVADGHFSRTAFGLSRWLPAVGDDVRLRIRAEFVRARADP
ncbi:YceI family protein, partial [Burkholderia pseudomallei]|uniref:YceI family protein n=1 Tax=Burkholderia pseudomallei TaxID=28450 RepID=UPI001F1B1F7E